MSPPLRTRTYRLRRSVTLVLVGFLLIFLNGIQGHGNPQSSPALGSPPESPVDLAALQQDLKVIRSDIAALSGQTQELLLRTNRQETIFTKIRDDYISNFLWEIFGFKRTEKTIIGIGFSVLGFAGFILRIRALQKKKEPPWLRIATIIYLGLVVLTLGALTFSGGIAREVSNPQASTTRLANRVQSLEATTTERLRDIEDAVNDVLRAHLEASQVADHPIAHVDTPAPEALWPKLISIETDVRRTVSLTEEAANHARTSAQTAEELLQRASQTPPLTKWLLICLLMIQLSWVINDSIRKRELQKRLASSTNFKGNDDQSKPPTTS